jgi:acyl CoA:acetate/3-ketoacid CoA transferase alpha subunit
MDMDDLYIQYDELVAMGELDPEETSIEDYIIDKISEATDYAMDRLDMER